MLWIAAPAAQEGGADGVSVGMRKSSVRSFAGIARHKRGCLAVAGAAALLLSACSDINFPAVHDMPAARADATLTPDQVKQATDELNCEREHLNTGTQAGGQVATTSSIKAPPGPQKASSSCGQPAATPAVATQPASAYARP